MRAALLITAIIVPSFAAAQSTFDDFASEMVDVGDVSLHVRSHGEGPAVVLMHGWAGSAHAWRDVAPILADAGHLVIVPDMRGYGASDKPSSMPGEDGVAQGGYDARTEADDVAALLDHYRAETAHVAGHDMGAPVALLFAADYPDRTLSMTYIDEPLIGYNHAEMTTFAPESGGGYWQFGLNWTPGMPEILYSGNERETVAYLLDAMTMADDVMTEADIDAHTAGLLDEGGIGGWVGWYRAVPQTAAQTREVVEAGLLREMPVLAVAGEGGIPIVPEQMEIVSYRVTGLVIEGSGHLVPEEKPRELAEAMLDFFEEVGR